MKIKAFEIRDSGTFIPVVGVLMVPNVYPDFKLGALDAAAAEGYLLRRAGYGEEPLVLLCRMEASGIDRNATYDPYAWGSGARTMTVAHTYIQAHWNELESGAVICVEHILGERETPKQSERFG